MSMGMLRMGNLNMFVGAMIDGLPSSPEDSNRGARFRGHVPWFSTTPVPALPANGK